MSARDKGDPPRSGWARSRDVLSMAAGVAAKELKLQIRSKVASSAENLGLAELQTRIDQARVMVESMGRLKGAFMKAGQLLSMDSSDVLPPEAVEVLSKLQSQAEPVDFAVVRGVLEAELGAHVLAALELDPVPAASASIGQVHKGKVSGESVAVKVQYPGIAESIDSDIGLLEKFATSALVLGRRDIALGGLFEELRHVLHLEADYDRERAQMETFRSLLEGDARFRVPRSYPALSSRRVLTMSWEDGLPLSRWVDAAPPMAQREELARTLLDLYCREFFEWGLVQTDPNYGNFLWSVPDGKLVLLDFGATLEYSREFRVAYVELLRAVASGSRKRIVDEGVAFGLFDARESEEARELFADMLLASAEPFDPRRQPFVFRDRDYAARSGDIGRRFARSLRFSPPPRQIIFLHRKLGGLFQILRRLDVQLTLTPYWERMLATVGPSAVAVSPTVSP